MKHEPLLEDRAHHLELIGELDRLNEDIIKFEEYKGETVEELKKRQQECKRKKRDLKTVKDMLYGVWKEVDMAFKTYGESMIEGEKTRIMPDHMKDKKGSSKADTLLGSPGECPVCGSDVDRKTLDDRRKELRECITDFAKAIRCEDEEIHTIKNDLDDLMIWKEDIHEKRRKRDKLKHDTRDMSIELEDDEYLPDCGLLCEDESTRRDVQRDGDGVVRCRECGGEMESGKVERMHIRDPDSYGCKTKYVVVGRRYECPSCGAEEYEEVRDKYGRKIE